jgi:hypothetical protein
MIRDGIGDSLPRKSISKKFPYTDMNSEPSKQNPDCEGV